MLHSDPFYCIWSCLYIHKPEWVFFFSSSHLDPPWDIFLPNLASHLNGVMEIMLDWEPGDLSSNRWEKEVSEWNIATSHLLPWRATGFPCWRGITTGSPCYVVKHCHLSLEKSSIIQRLQEKCAGQGTWDSYILSPIVSIARAHCLN